MNTIDKFIFYPRFAQFQDVKGVTVENSHKILNKIIKDEELSIGHK